MSDSISGEMFNYDPAMTKITPQKLPVQKKLPPEEQESDNQIPLQEIIYK